MTPTDLIAAYNALPAAGQAAVRRHVLTNLTAPAVAKRRRDHAARMARVASLIALHDLPHTTTEHFRALIRHLEASDYTLGERHAVGYGGRPLNPAALREAYQRWVGSQIPTEYLPGGENHTLTAQTTVATTPITTHSVIVGTAQTEQTT